MRTAELEFNVLRPVWDEVALLAVQVLDLHHWCRYLIFLPLTIHLTQALRRLNIVFLSQLLEETLVPDHGST